MTSETDGRPLAVVEKTISQDQLVRYAHASGDHNPLHLDHEFAAASEFKGIIAHGMLTLAFISEMLTLEFGRDWIESGRLKVKFKGPAYPGQTVKTWGTVVKEEQKAQRRTLECVVGLSNSEGEELLTGTAYLTQGI